jgi:hypothetical protein
VLHVGRGNLPFGWNVELELSNESNVARALFSVNRNIINTYLTLSRVYLVYELVKAQPEMPVRSSGMH